METFSSFSYLVRNDFIYKDKVEVRVFFIYLDKGVVNKSLFLDKVNNKPERLYIADAKKIINKMIANGALEKYAKEHIKHTKNKKMGITFAAVVVSTLVIAGAGVGIYFALNKPLIEAKVELPEINGLIFDNQKAYVGMDYDTNISINTDLITDLTLPDHLSKVISGNYVLIDTEYTYTVNDKHLSGSLHIPGKYVEGNMKIELKLVEIPWYINKKYLASLTKKDITKEGGTINTVEVNGLQHKVRLIGVDEDADAEGNTIHTTWEFANIICDSNGHSIATQWHDTNDTSSCATNYLDSTLRKALNGTGGADHFLWAEMGATTWSTKYTKPVIDMLPQELVSAMKAPKKYTFCFDTSWEPKLIETNGVCDKLFLLTPMEMGYSCDPSEIGYTSTYNYYLSATEASDEKRIKEQIDEEGAVEYESQIGADAGQAYQSTVTNKAGYKGYMGSGGNTTYFRLPNTKNNFHLNVYTLVKGEILGESHWANANAFCVAPAFCL